VLLVPNQLSVRVYETEESFHGRQETLSRDGLFFSFRFRSMARPFLVFRWRRSISVSESFNLGREYRIEAARERAREMAAFAVIVLTSAWPVVYMIVTVVKLLSKTRPLN